MRYGNLLIEGIVSTHGSATDAVNAETLAFELGSATTGNANGGDLTFKPGAGAGTATLFGSTAGGDFLIMEFAS